MEISQARRNIEVAIGSQDTVRHMDETAPRGLRRLRLRFGRARGACAACELYHSITGGSRARVNAQKPHCATPPMCLTRHCTANAHAKRSMLPRALDFIAGAQARRANSSSEISKLA